MVRSVSIPPTTRRAFLKLVSSASVVGPAGIASAMDAAPAAENTAIADEVLRIEFDSSLRSRVFFFQRGAHGPRRIALTQWAATEYLLLADGSRVDQFAVSTKEERRIAGPHGAGTQLTLVGSSASHIEKRIQIELFERYPGLAISRVSYRNLSSRPVPLSGWRSADVELLPAAADPRATLDADAPQFWSYCGSTHEDRRDWVQPVRAGFAQDNFMGMSASDYGGGIPIVDVWRPDCGLAVGHLELTPRLVSLPVKHTARGASLGIAGNLKKTLGPGDRLETPEAFIATHAGDYFTTLDAYRRLMSDRGVCPAPPPESAYESIWCAWGYERQCTPQLIEDTLPKVKELGLRWAVVDDGWQSNVGDWTLNAAKFPKGAEDM